VFRARPYENLFLFFLRWVARVLGAISIGAILLFIFAGGIDISKATWEEFGVMMLFPLGLLSGLILSWEEELKGSAVALFSIGAFFFVHGLVMKGNLSQTLWLAVFALPGILFLMHGVLSLSAKDVHKESDGSE
jgi:hypothetical protein